MTRWDDLANCKGQHVNEFYPDPQESGSNGHVLREIQALCSDCPVKDACRVASVPEKWGYWGGLTAKERRVMRAKIGYVPAIEDKDIGRFRRAADRAFLSGDYLKELARLIGVPQAARALAWRPGGA